MSLSAEIQNKVSYSEEDGEGSSTVKVTGTSMMHLEKKYAIVALHIFFN